MQNKCIGVKLHGGLGNRLFKIASGYGIAKEQNKEMVIAVNSVNLHSNEDYSQTVFRKCKYQEIENPDINNEPEDFCCRKMKVISSENNILLEGYYQSERYFNHCKQDIYELFEMENERKEYLVNKYTNLDSGFFIHFRRGDYLNVQIHNINLETYYLETIKYIKTTHPGSFYYIFSDDIAHCKNIDLLKMIDSSNICFVENENEINSLYLMSLCKKGGIACNSSFSWWGGFLNENQNKEVFFPDKWFNNDWLVETGFDGCKIINVTKPTFVKTNIPRIDLRNTTFMIPIHIDHSDRFINLIIQIKFLLSNFDTNIVIIEDGLIEMYPLLKTRYLKDYDLTCVNYEFQYCEDRLFHRMRILNECLIKVKTSVCVVHDCDILVNPIAYKLAENNIMNKEFDIIHPFNCELYLIDQSVKYEIDINKPHIFIDKYREYPRCGNGYTVFFNTEKYIKMGGENEKFLAYGPEDEERIYRALYNGLKYAKVNTPVFHLEHWRGENSGTWNPYFNQNHEVFNALLEIYKKANINIRYSMIELCDNT